MAKQTKEEIALQLKSAIYLHVAKIVEEKVKDLNQEEDNSNDNSIIATPTFIAQLVELVYNQLINLGEDLELFCHHAGRDIVEPLDLYMVTRKNPTLQQFLKDIEQKNKE
ncbi:MHF histone-fold complex subunit 1 [Candida viswanathii]|uniref:MHF histone-fold complex subunit 1 n=1 Tax=Candida viswanathii TaxID=5486 RepID=A0A367YE59_9ASCO|nr:MHF histone-fold complex subunit 1 [Candida viswanathii]